LSKEQKRDFVSTYLEIVATAKLVELVDLHKRAESRELAGSQPREYVETEISDEDRRRYARERDEEAIRRVQAFSQVSKTNLFLLQLWEITGHLLFLVWALALVFWIFGSYHMGLEWVGWLKIIGGYHLMDQLGVIPLKSRYPQLAVEEINARLPSPASTFVVFAAIAASVLVLVLLIVLK